ncbi:protein scabrous [Musca vetustissima]|uniref:protein scabrous n=1 Tax=Musca vetustissima TaxID=27455 RepID=UPI002AB7DA8E|nr:protein scabrous [Musca vetustissima]
MPIIALQLLITSGFAGWSEASVIIDMNNMLRDTSTESMNTMPSTMSSMAATASSSSSAAYEHRQMTENILRSDNDGTDDNGLYNSYNEPSAELLRFVDDDDSDNSEDATDSDYVQGGSADNSVDNEIHLPSRQSRQSNTNNIHDEDDNDNNNNSYMQSLSLRDQVRLLSKQLNVLMNRRREDYELLERNLRKSLRITQDKHSDAAAGAQDEQTNPNNDLDLRKEVETLRREVQELRNGHLLGTTIIGANGGHKERLTIEWLQQSVGELRKQLVELQSLASNAMRDVNTRTQSWEDLTTIRSDFQQLKLELAALKERQQQTDVYVQELREETEQQEEDYKRLVMHLNQKQTSVAKDNADDDSTNAEQQQQSLEVTTQTPRTLPSVDLLADHKRRHVRYQRQQLHELQLAQRQLRRQFNELKYHRIGERVRSIEIEQHRVADANFNLSRQIASLDKLHTSMLELLEDVEQVQTKVDKNLPELRHEISKLEFGHAQLMSEQNLVREEGKNVARSLQALAYSVGTLQEERDGVRRMQSSVGEMRTQLDRLQTMVDDIQRALQHRQHRGGAAHINKKSNHHQRHHNNNSNNNNDKDNESEDNSPQNAESLVAKLENVEQQFESIIAKLPRDCSEVTPSETTTNDGLYLIAPAGDHHPQMAHCTPDGWTTVQRRYDGSADFNRSWEDYASGFGSPAGEFWIGNEQLHHLTLNNCTRLRVLMQDIYDNVWLAEYNQFYISSRSDGYRLHIGGYSGNASDALDYQQGMQFSAIDVDRDISQTHCAANYEGGWWFSHCQHANLNGRYNLGLTWFDAQRNEWIAVKSSQMMIKRQSHETCNYGGGGNSDLTTATSTVSETTTATATTTTTTTTLTINSDKSIPLNNLRPVDGLTDTDSMESV